MSQRNRLNDPLAIEGAIVTIDATGCQRDIARKVLDKGQAMSSA